MNSTDDLTVLPLPEMGMGVQIPNWPDYPDGDPKYLTFPVETQAVNTRDDPAPLLDAQLRSMARKRNADTAWVSETCYRTFMRRRLWGLYWQRVHQHYRYIALGKVANVHEKEEKSLSENGVA